MKYYKNKKYKNYERVINELTEKLKPCRRQAFIDLTKVRDEAYEITLKYIDEKKRMGKVNQETDEAFEDSIRKVFHAEAEYSKAYHC